MDYKLWTKLWDRYLQYNPAATIGELQTAKDRGRDYLGMFTEAIKLDEVKSYD